MLCSHFHFQFPNCPTPWAWTSPARAGTTPTQKTKRKQTVTAFTEEQKEEIIEFLMRNLVFYSLVGFKDVTHKEDLWDAQASNITTTVVKYGT